MSWSVGPPRTYRDEVKKASRDIVCDQEIAVVGLQGWCGKARVYDLQTGEVRFGLECNHLGDGHDDFIRVRLGTDIIVTLSDNDNTLTIWNKSNGEMLAQNLHKDEKKTEELMKMQSLEGDKWNEWLDEKTVGFDEDQKVSFFMEYVSSLTDQREIIDVCVKDDLIYGGYGEGFLIIGKQDGDWKIIEDIKLGYKVRDVLVAGKLIAIGKNDDDDQWEKKTINFWDPEKKERINEMEMEVTVWYCCKFVYPYMFFIDIQRGKVFDEFQTGIEIWNVETKEPVRQLLKGYKKYEYISTNGKFLAICELLDGFSSGEEKYLELTVFNVEQLVDKSIAEEDLWRFTKEYKLCSMDHIRAAFNEDHLIVSHSAETLDIHALG